MFLRLDSRKKGVANYPIGRALSSGRIAGVASFGIVGGKSEKSFKIDLFENGI